MSTRAALHGRLERAIEGWTSEQIADLCALLESRGLTATMVREALDPDSKLSVVPISFAPPLRRESFMMPFPVDLSKPAAMVSYPRNMARVTLPMSWSLDEIKAAANAGISADAMLEQVRRLHELCAGDIDVARKIMEAALRAPTGDVVDVWVKRQGDHWPLRVSHQLWSIAVFADSLPFVREEITRVSWLAIDHESQRAKCPRCGSQTLKEREGRLAYCTDCGEESP